MQIIGGKIVTDGQNSDNKKILRIAIVAIFVLVILIMLLFSLSKYLEAKQFKFYIDNINSEYEADLFVIENDNIYTSIKDISKKIGYSAYNGEYLLNSEDKTKMYAESKEEIVAFYQDSDKIYKTTLNNGVLDWYSYDLKENIRNINGKLYISEEGLQIAYNLVINYTKEKNSVTIQTLNFLVNSYNPLLIKKGYTGIAPEFNNKKAILKGLFVVVKDKKYGVISANFDDVIGVKYEKLDYIENTEEFFATNLSKTGILANNGDNKIDLLYDNIKLISKELKLWNVTKNNKNGIVDKNGKIVLYLEYDEIGVDANFFATQSIKNTYILYDNAIPIKQNNKWGLINKSGKLILPIQYDTIGNIQSTSKDKTENNLLLIPYIDGIVINKNNKYGVVNSLGEILINCNYDKIFSATSNGKEEFYVELNKEIMVLDVKKQGTSSTTSNDEKIQIEL